MLYQKGTQRIEVIVRKEGGGVSGAKTTEPDEVRNSTESLDTDTTNTKVSSRALRTNITHGFATARQVTLLGANYLIQGIGNYTGDQSYQQLVEREVEIFQDVSGFASSIAMGATFGGIYGALFAAVGTGASTGLKYMSRQRDFNYKVFKENNAIEYQRARASISLTAGRLR